MVEPTWLRVVSLDRSARESSVDAALREHVLPGLMGASGLVDVWIGRQGADDRERVIASTWSDPPGGDPELALLDRAAFEGERPATTATEMGRIRVRARFERSEPARLLRILRGRTHPGELDAYVETVRAGMEADAASNPGLVGLVLAAVTAETFTTLSEWVDWPSVEQATGGNVRHPLSTRHHDQLAEFRVRHYEILPPIDP